MNRIMFRINFRQTIFALATCAMLATIMNITTAHAQHSNDFAPVKEHAVAYKNWTYKDFKTNQPVNLREWSKDKKLVMVVYFAPWCGNWKNEAPLVARLHDKYKDKGFDVIAVSEYAPIADSVAYFGDKGAPYTVVYESDARDARDKTEHYACRIKTGDARRWGSPYHVLLEPAKLVKTGDVLTERTNFVVGDLIEDDIEKFIREKLAAK